MHMKRTIWKRIFQISRSPQVNLVWGFFLYTVMGFVLLSIPFLQKTEISIIDTLFMATSAISTTGLVTFGLVDSYTFFGQLVVMLLFQLGGMGHMSLTTYFLLLTKARVDNSKEEIIETEFRLPDNIGIRDFIKSVVFFTLIMEFIGALVFYLAFVNAGMGYTEAIWPSIFHSVSSFCTAGFSIFDTSFQGYADNIAINAVITVLAITGSMGFVVITDFWYRISGRRKALSFNSKIIFYGFFLLLVVGTLVIYFGETAISGTESSLAKSFFQTMTAMTTTGFSTVAVTDLSLPILIFVTFLMYVGASPSGTAGGVKITTMATMVAILKSRLLGQKRISLFGYRYERKRLYAATSIFLLYLSFIFLFTIWLTYTEKAGFRSILFEVASALGTVGLSDGVTGNLSLSGKIAIVLLMFIGRIGVLNFAFALIDKDDGGATQD